MSCLINLQRLSWLNHVCAGLTKTNNATNWTLNLWKEWQQSRKDMGTAYPFTPLHLLTEKMSNEWMCKFILEARHKDEVEYPPTSLYKIASGIIRLIKIMHHQSISSCSLNKFGNFYKQKLSKRWKELRYTKNASKNKPGRLKHQKMNPK